MEGFNILDYVPRFPEAFEALGRWQSEGKLVQRRMWLSVYASPSKSGIWAIVLPRRWEDFGEADGIFRAPRLTVCRTPS
jgi:hypothetical protein